MSRYYDPGSVQQMWNDDAHHEPCVVLATSRHKRRVSREDAIPVLVEAWAVLYERTAVPSSAEWCRWRSVTQADIDRDECGAADLGGWHTEGTGSAFIDVLRCDATDAPPAPSERGEP